MISSSFDDRRWTTRRIDGEKVRVRTDYRGNKPWRVRWREYPGGPQKYSPYMTTKAMAQAHLVEVQHSLLSGAYVDPKAGRITLRQYAEDWSKRRVWARQTRDRIERELRLHILPTLGERPLGSFKTHHIEEWAGNLKRPNGEPLAPSSVETVHATLVTLFNGAVKDGRINQNPAKGAELPKVVKSKFVPMTVEQVRAYVLGLPEHVRAAGVLAAATGMRQGELFGVTLDRIDFARKRLHVEQQLVTPDGQRPYLAPLKTDNSDRWLRLNDLAVHALVAHLATYPIDENLIVLRKDSTGKTLGEANDLVFRSGPLPVTRAMATNYAIRAAAKTPRPDARWHDLRHHYASLLLSKGVGPAVVADRVGDTIKVLLDTYAHVMPSDEEQVLAVIDETLGESIESWLSPEGVDDESAAS